MYQPTEDFPKVVPAQVGYLAIYNPSLGTNDDTIQNQIVYYYSQAAPRRSRERSQEQQNEELRQIGLAQGMVEFSKNFSNGNPVDTVDTEKSRIVLHELESGWWILASIDLMVLPRAYKVANTKDKAADEQGSVEYSSLEVKPAVLLLQDLLQAHSTFLLHHASSLSALFVRTRRPKFLGLLTRYWDTYLSTWNVLMHGNPANNLYGGIKVAACGELGIGVGEEERGSGEREVLEGLVGRIDGLVDIIVSKFGGEHPSSDWSNQKTISEQTAQSGPWLGSGNEPHGDDGAIFLGTGALSRKSLRDVSHWVQDLYRWDSYAYGVIDNPTSNRRAKTTPKAHRSKKELSPDAKESARQVYGLPHRQKSKGRKSLTTVDPLPVEDGGSHDKHKAKHRRPSFHRGSTSTDSESNRTMNFVSYLKFGYGTHWTLGSTSTKDESHNDTSEETQTGPNRTSAGKHSIDGDQTNTSLSATKETSNDSVGHYIIGLKGDLDNESVSLGNDASREVDDGANISDRNSRLLIRTLTVELEREEDARAETDISIDLGSAHSDVGSSKFTGSERTGGSNVSSYESQDRNKTKKLRVVVYAKKPFIFVLLFELRSDALAWNGLYRSLHSQIGPLVKPLLNSTRFRAPKPDITPNQNETDKPIYDLIWDPKSLTIHSTIPNIPDPRRTLSEYIPPDSPWSRIEALNTHMQILNTYTATKTDKSQMERTCKTSRGWWIVWTRIPEPEPSPTPNSRSSGQVQIPHLIPEDSIESQSSLSISTNNHLSPPNNNKSQDERDKSSTVETGTSTQYSGPAHPFQESAANTVQKVKEIFLIRRASDYRMIATAAARLSSRFTGREGIGGLGGGGGGGDGDGGSKIARGIGVDTKRYIDGLLGVSR